MLLRYIFSSNRLFTEAFAAKASEIQSLRTSYIDKIQRFVMFRSTQDIKIQEAISGAKSWAMLYWT